MSRRGKYMWSDEDFKRYCEKQSKEIYDDLGIKASTAGITKMVLD